MRPTYRATYQKYKCRSGHVSEILIEDSKRMKAQKCLTCSKRAEHSAIVSRREAIQATIIYEKPGENGKVERMYVDPKVPESCAIAEKEGFQRREIQGLHQMRRFEREVEREMRAERAEEMRGEDKHRQEFYQQYHSDLRGLMNRSDVHQFWKEVFRTAIEETGHGSQRDYSPEFRNAAYS